MCFRISDRARRALICGAVGAVAAGCQMHLPRGENTLDAELERLHAASLVHVGETRAAFRLNGSQVEVVPADGYCIAPETVEMGNGLAFMLLNVCTPSPGALALEALGIGGLVPESDPETGQSIMTLSLSGRPLFAETAGFARDLDGLAAFLETPAGLRLLSRHGGAEGVEIAETRRIGDALYVRVREEGAGFLAAEFWRAFTEINDRMVVIGVSGFAGQRQSDQAMLALLALQATQLRAANAEGLVDEELALAVETDRGLRTVRVFAGIEGRDLGLAIPSTTATLPDGPDDEMPGGASGTGLAALPRPSSAGAGGPLVEPF